MTDKNPAWGQSIGTIIGGAVYGPIGAVIGGILGGVLDSTVLHGQVTDSDLLTNLLTDIRAAVIGEIGSEAVKKAKKGIDRWRKGDESLPVNDDLQEIKKRIKRWRKEVESLAVDDDLPEACCKALRAAICEIGGLHCFPTQGEKSTLQIPPEIRITPDRYSPGQLVRICHFLNRLYQRVDQIFSLDKPPAQLNDLQFYLKKESDITIDFRTHFWQTVIYPYLQQDEKDLLSDLPIFEIHLRRYLGIRMLVHVGENLKESDKAWRAFSRLVFDAVFEQLAALRTADQELLSELKATQRLLNEKLATVDLAAWMTVNTQQVANINATLVGMQQRIDELTQLIQQLLHQSRQQKVTGAPALPEQPPWKLLENFIGRTADVHQCAESLQHTGLLLIAGMSGVGKSALALNLAYQIAGNRKLVFWHQFNENYDAKDIFDHLGRFLAAHGNSAFWYKWNRSRRPSQGEAWADLLQALRGNNYVLCFDNFYPVRRDPMGKKKAALQPLIDQMKRATADGGLLVIVTTRHRSPFGTDVHPILLRGLSLQDTTVLLENAGLQLAPPLTKAIHRRTEGNAQLLQLMVQILKSNTDHAVVIEKFRETAAVKPFLFEQIDTTLSLKERNVMLGLSILFGYPATAEAIEAILDAGDLSDALYALSNRNLIQQSEGTLLSSYRLHALLQAHYYAVVKKDKKGNHRLLHQRAGRYYEADAFDPLLAVLHFYYGGDAAQAAQLVITHVTTIIQRGQASGVQAIVAQLLSSTTAIWEKIALMIVDGKLHDAMDDQATAETRFTAALRLLDPLPATDENQLLRIRAYHGLGKSLELKQPQSAATHLETAITLFDSDSHLFSATMTQAVAELYVDLGNVYIYLGDYDKARQSLDQGLQRLPDDPPTAVHSIAYKALNTIYLYQGDLTKAQDYATKALTISRKLGADFETATMLVNLSSIQYAQGDWLGTLTTLTEALTLADRLNSTEIKAAASLNLGDTYSKMGDDDAAYAALKETLQLATDHQLHVLEIFANFTLANQHLKIERWTDAYTNLQLAEKRSTEIEHESSKTVIASLRAELSLGQKQFAVAQAYAQQAITLAQATGETPDEGIAQRLLGQALLAQQQVELAFAAFERSLALLADNDLYEVARTQVQLGLVHFLRQNRIEAETFLQAAKATFLKLGARRDLAKLEQSTQSLSS